MLKEWFVPIQNAFCWNVSLGIWSPLRLRMTSFLFRCYAFIDCRPIGKNARYGITIPLVSYPGDNGYSDSLFKVQWKCRRGVMHKQMEIRGPCLSVSFSPSLATPRIRQSDSTRSGGGSYLDVLARGERPDAAGKRTCAGCPQSHDVISEQSPRAAAHRTHSPQNGSCHRRSSALTHTYRLTSAYQWYRGNPRCLLWIARSKSQYAMKSERSSLSFSRAG